MVRSRSCGPFSCVSPTDGHLDTEVASIRAVPGDHAAVMGRFAEELIVPETHGAAKELTRRHREGQVPQKVVKTRLDAPCTQCVK